MAWHAKPRCPGHLVATLERAVNALRPEWLLPPQAGETYDSIEHYRRRLQDFALAKLDVVPVAKGLMKQDRARLGRWNFLSRMGHYHCSRARLLNRCLHSRCDPDQLHSIC